ncbi:MULTISPECIES: sensor domain-containing diguanylate cyclase [Pseudomonas]|uniref:diguanylate cyclase n=1 Tax=Pseudomonas luteola TaxID=47886 RepID=A0A2X2DBY1_PSELU|nr:MULTISPECIES: sensor domain-containing diguanylate cyclase [Pseudomonas]RRW44614.1 GGDEF domain-containing protein [Pseudomonas luteola]SPZ16914.1 phytochrome-like protein Cph2 [Pseudomonas luteola]
MSHPDSMVSKKLKRLPLETLTMAFLGLVFVSLVGFDFWQSWHARDVQLQQSESTTLNLTRALAQHAEDSFQEVDVALMSLQHLLEQGNEISFKPDALHTLLEKYAGSLEQVEGLFVFDEQGNWRATSLGETLWKGQNSDRGYFRFHNQNTTEDPFISRAIHSRSTGNWIIPISRRVTDKQGRFAGVVLATVRMEYFLDFYRHIELGPSGAIVLAMPDGTILSRRPFKDEYLVGKHLAQSYVITTALAQAPSGIVTIKAVIDGVERLYGYQLIDRYSLLVMVAMSKKELLSDWTGDTQRSAIIVASLIIVMSLFGLVLMRQIGHANTVKAELIEAHRALERQALSDGLTGLANRRYFDMALQQELKRAERSGQPLSLIMLDIDFFKGYNDHYGHPAGDYCLKQVAQALKHSLPRSGDFAARYGGEEMAAILPACDRQGAWIVAKRIQDQLRKLRLEHHNSPFGVVTVSGGIHTYMPGEDGVLTGQTLIECADSALYEAKRNGRNRMVATESSHT